MITYFEIWGVPPGGKSRVKIAEYEEKYWQRAEKRAANLEENEYTKIVIYEKTKSNNVDKKNLDL
jgi:hypothetical protein